MFYYNRSENQLLLFNVLYFYSVQISTRVDVRLVEKIIAESLSQHDEKHVVQTPLSGIRVGKRSLLFGSGHQTLARHF
jgi:hypothetical protein